MVDLVNVNCLTANLCMLQDSLVLANSMGPFSHNLSKLNNGKSRPLLSAGVIYSILNYNAFEQCSNTLTIMLIIMPKSTAIMPQFVYDFIIIF